MSLPDVKSLVSGDKKVRFIHYRQGELWYEVEGGFRFPVPTADTGDGVFLAEDRALLFMRYIRRHLDMLKAAQAEAHLAPGGL